MKLLIDCDVLLDVALRREPHFSSSARLLDWAESRPGRAAVAWHTLSNIVYLCGHDATAFIDELIEFAEVPTCGTDSVRFALEIAMKDFEDAMQVAAADSFGAQLIATRKVKDYGKSPIKAMTPKAILPLLSS